MFSQATLLLALAASASAHMVLSNPVPFGKASLNNSPLAPGDFPCKQRSGVYDVTQMNQWDAGTTQVISFTGSAVHGGGSCQFSITTDPEPTDKSQWKVIQSVIGGCPSNVSGNLPEDANGHQASTFPVTMPATIPEGRYTFAWTWLNKVGNREFYMNCAPVQVGSGSGSASTASAASALGALPDMFVANLPSTECETTSSTDFSYPNPGENVVEGNGASLSTAVTGSGCATQNKIGAGNGQLGNPSAGTPSQGTPVKSSSAASLPKTSEKPAATPLPSSTAPSASSNAPSASKIPSSPGGVFAPGASSAAASGSTAQPTTPVAKPVPSATPAAPNNSTPVSAECTPCTNDGAVVCIGSKQFGLCNRGCAVAQDLAAGMVCTNGVVGGAAKRHVHFPRAHLRRGLSAARLF